MPFLVALSWVFRLVRYPGATPLFCRLSCRKATSHLHKYCWLFRFIIHLKESRRNHHHIGDSLLSNPTRVWVSFSWDPSQMDAVQVWWDIDSSQQKKGNHNKVRRNVTNRNLPIVVALRPSVSANDPTSSKTVPNRSKGRACHRREHLPEEEHNNHVIHFWSAAVHPAWVSIRN